MQKALIIIAHKTKKTGTTIGNALKSINEKLDKLN